MYFLGWGTAFCVAGLIIISFTRPCLACFPRFEDFPVVRLGSARFPRLSVLHGGESLFVCVRFVGVLTISCGLILLYCYN